MSTIVINAEIKLVSPLSISMPTAEGQLPNRFNNFPIMSNGVDDEGNVIKTGYLPSTTIRGFLRRAVVTERMVYAAKQGKHYTVQDAYSELIGQDADSETKNENFSLLNTKKIRDENEVLDLFGCGLGLKSRLLVSHFLPTHSVLPECFTAPRKDLVDTDGIIEALSEDGQNVFFNRFENNSKRSAVQKTIKKLGNAINKLKKSGVEDSPEMADLQSALEIQKGIEKDIPTDLMSNSSRTIVNSFALPQGIEMKGRLVVEKSKERDLPMIIFALNQLSLRPIFGAQAARGCGEISGKFIVRIDGKISKIIEVGGWEEAKVTDF